MQLNHTQFKPVVVANMCLYRRNIPMEIIRIVNNYVYNLNKLDIITYDDENMCNVTYIVNFNQWVKDAFILLKCMVCSQNAINNISYRLSEIFRKLIEYKDDGIVIWKECDKQDLVITLINLVKLTK